MVLEQDDRRHCVIWSPPKLPQRFFDQVTEEIENGGIAALHQYLLDLDLGDFREWTPPPLTGSKEDLIQQSTSSEERFVNEWIRQEVPDKDGEPLPFCPCLGSHLYTAYVRWCDGQGERRRRSQDLIGHCNKRHGWSAGRAVSLWDDFNGKRPIKRKMVVPSADAIYESIHHCQSGRQERYRESAFDTRAHWLTTGYYEFRDAVDVD